MDVVRSPRERTARRNDADLRAAPDFPRNQAMVPARTERLKMATPQTVSNTAPEAPSGTSSPNQFHLHGSHLLGHSIRISYYPDGAGPVTNEGPVILAYHDAHQTLTFHKQRTEVVPVGGLGTCVTVTIHPTIDADSITATLLVPGVALVAGQPATVETELITTLHHGPDSGFGDPQRDHYTVTALTGQASRGPLPL
jgi:hypothetical protein